MSDESDTSDAEIITVHKHPWRSQSRLNIGQCTLFKCCLYYVEFNEWMDELDKRYRRKLERNSSITPSKQRQIGSPSTCVPPPGAPTWAINPEWIRSSSGIVEYCSSCLHFKYPRELGSRQRGSSTRYVRTWHAHKLTVGGEMVVITIKSMWDSKYSSELFLLCESLLQQSSLPLTLCPCYPS